MLKKKKKAYCLSKTHFQLVVLNFYLRNLATLKSENFDESKTIFKHLTFCSGELQNGLVCFCGCWAGSLLY